MGYGIQNTIHIGNLSLEPQNRQVNEFRFNSYNYNIRDVAIQYRIEIYNKL